MVTPAVAAAQIRDGGAAVAAETLDAGQLTTIRYNSRRSDLS